MSTSDRLKEIGDDLLSMEVNTILKANISATKMPDPDHALMDLSIEMWNELQVSDKLWNQYANGGWSGWHACRQEAMSQIQARREARQPNGKLDRIVAACDQLKGVLYDCSSDQDPCGKDCRIERQETGAITHMHGQTWNGSAWVGGNKLSRIEPNGRQLAVLRKLWEVGLEEVMAQTVIQIDGDIVTRVHPRAKDDEALMRLHKESLLIARAYWSELADIATKVLGLLVSK